MDLNSKLFFYTKPLEHQARTVSIAVHHNNFGIFDEPGTGKTKLAIDIAVNKYLQNQIKEVTIVAPATLARTWIEEINKHCHPKYHHIFMHNRRECTKANYDGWAIMSHGIVSRGYIPYIEDKKLVIVDESHNFKNVDSNRGGLFHAFADEYKHILSLTGTPRGNNSTDIFIQMKLLGSKISFAEFTTKHCYKERVKINHRYFTKYSKQLRCENKIMDYLAPKSSWTKKRDVIDLPQRHFIKLYYDLTSAQKKAIAQFRASVDKLIVNDEVIRKTNQTINQIYSGFVKKNEEYIPIKCGKLDILADLLNNLDHSTQFIIFCNFYQELTLVGSLLDKQNISKAMIDGRVDMEAREKIKNDFKGGKYRCLYGNVTVLKEGYSFNNATVLIYYSNNYDLIARLQSLERNQRVGQTEICTVYDIVNKGGYDDLLLNQIENKNILLDNLYNYILNERTK